MRFLSAEEADDAEFVQQIVTDTGVAARSFERLPGGSRSVAYATENLVIRFPKAEIIWRVMQREQKIIEAVYPHLEAKIPDKIHKIELIAEEYPFSVSRRFEGKICDGRCEEKYATNYEILTAQQQENLARQIAKFFAAMHTIDYETLSLAPVDASMVPAMESWNVTRRPDYDYEQVKTALLRHSDSHLNLDDYKTEDKEIIEALCHNDLSGSNMLIDPETYNVLCGIIDFGNARIVPIEQDFFPLYKINRKLALDTLKIYNKIVSNPLDRQRVEALALNYIGYGLARSNNGKNAYLIRLLEMFL